MANSQYGNVITADSVGILTKTPVRVLAICFNPNQQADTITLNWWDEANAISSSEKFLSNVTITGTTTITDAATGGVLTSIYADGAVLKLFKTVEGGGNGSTANHTYHLITTAGDNNVIVTAATLTNEANKSQKIIAYPARTAFILKQPNDTNEQSLWYNFGYPGLWFPNLTLESVSTSASALIYIA